MLVGGGVLLIAGTVFMIHCRTRIDVPVDGIEVVGVKASSHQGWLLRAKLDPNVLWYMLDHGVLRWCLNSDAFNCINKSSLAWVASEFSQVNMDKVII